MRTHDGFKKKMMFLADGLKFLLDHFSEVSVIFVNQLIYFFYRFQ